MNTQKIKEIEILKETMIKLINETANSKENFIFEEMQQYMDLTDLSNPKWTNNVRLRMIENNEAFELGVKSCEEEQKKKFNSFEETKKEVYKELEKPLKDKIDFLTFKVWLITKFDELDEIFYPKEEPKKAEVGK